jgi:ribosomal protein S18 acetylase RimI-like enzyme
MLNLNRDKFDSEIFDAEVYRVLASSEELEEPKLRHALVSTPFDVAYCILDFNPAAFSTLSKIGFGLVSVRATYNLGNLKSSEKVSTPSNEAFRIVRLSRETVSVRDDDLNELAEVIAENSRYIKDSKLPAQKSYSLYRKWLSNSVHHGYANETIVALKGQEVVGIITLKIKGDYGCIDLLGIKSTFQNQGIGKLLLAQTKEYFVSSNIEKILVTTEAENIKSNIFYQRNGFVIQEISFAYHLHQNELTR